MFRLFICQFVYILNSFTYEKRFFGKVDLFVPSLGVNEAIFHVALTYLRFKKNKNKKKKICPPAPSPKSCERQPNNYFCGPKRCRVDVCSSDVIKIKLSVTKIIIHDKLNLAVIFDIIYFLFTFPVLTLQQL